jgi:hypothetical protein
MKGIMLSLTRSKMNLLALAYLFLYASLPIFEVGSSNTLVTRSSKSLYFRILNTLAFQALKLESPSSLSYSLNEYEAMMISRSDYEIGLLLI